MILHYTLNNGQYTFQQSQEPFYPLIYYTDSMGNKWAHNETEGYFEYVGDLSQNTFKNIYLYQALTNCIQEFKDGVDINIMDKYNLGILTQSIYNNLEIESNNLFNIDTVIQSTEDTLYDLLEDTYKCNYTIPYWRL